MFGLDERVAAVGSGDAFLAVAAVAVLLGLRHATDPDHLAAVSTLVATDDEPGPRRAGLLGLSWGLGHGTTLLVFGFPIVVFGDDLPEAVQRAAEVAVGLAIMALALRLLVHWRRGGLRAHAHGRSTHPRRRAPGTGGPPEDGHRAGALGRSPLQSFGIGLIHGMAGSAGVGVLLLAAIPSHVEGSIALVLFALFSAVSMAMASTAFGYTLSRGPVLRRSAAVAPILATLSFAFGVWYSLGALEAVPYYF